ncbi:MAG: energy transducer TonB [Bacteroidota bacterium]
MDLRNVLRFFFIGAMLSLVLNTAFAQIDTQPKPYGGKQLMKEFICDEMIYPDAAIKAKTEGIVKVGVTIMTNGKKTNYRIAESVSPELDNEALRICKLIMFYPAVKSSNNIIEDVVIPVKFNIKKYKRNCKQKGFDHYEGYAGTVDTSMIVYASKELAMMPRPEFKDPGMNFSKFIVENMKYPEIAFRQSITGQVELSFIVETSGRISNIEIINALGGGCTEEAIHLLKQILWIPGIRKGIAVRSFMTANINFSLDNNSEHKYLPNHNNATM